MVGAFRQDGLVAHFLHGTGQGVVVDELGIAERGGPHTEQLFDAVIVQADLLPELVRRVEEGQRVVVGLGKQLHAAGGHQLPVALDDFRGVGLELVQGRAGDGETHLELPLMAPDELEQQGVHGQIAFARHLEEDAAVGVLVLVPGIGADIEEGVVAQAVRLMYLKIETDGGHAISSPQQAGRRWRAAWWRHSPSGCSSVLHGNCGLPRRPAGDRPAGRRSCWPFPAHPRSRP